MRMSERKAFNVFLFLLFLYSLSGIWTGVYFHKRHGNRPMVQLIAPLLVPGWPIYWAVRFADWTLSGVEPLPAEEIEP